MSSQETITMEDFEQISDIREELYLEKIDECEKLKWEIASYKESCQHWKNAYESAMKRILDYCTR